MSRSRRRWVLIPAVTLLAVFPAQEVVVVRLGSTDAGVDWQSWLRGVEVRVSR